MLSVNSMMLMNSVRNNDANTALFLAACNGHVAVVKSLLDNGAEPDALCADGETALMQAAWAGHTSLLKLLLGNGSSINAVTPSGMTALYQGTIRLSLSFSLPADKWFDSFKQRAGGCCPVSASCRC